MVIYRNWTIFRKIGKVAPLTNRSGRVPTLNCICVKIMIKSFYYSLTFNWLEYEEFFLALAVRKFVCNTTEPSSIFTSTREENAWSYYWFITINLRNIRRGGSPIFWGPKTSKAHMKVASLHGVSAFYHLSISRSVLKICSVKARPCWPKWAISLYILY